MYNIEFYENKNGKSEILEYIQQLQNSNSKSDRIKANKIYLYINLLSKRGLSIGEPYIKHLDNEIWELRPIRDRILFASLYNNKFILLNVFMKKSRKTPKKEIEKAKNLLKEYNRKGVVKK